jgi:3-phosphoshikimate 1-carboxyvinyltransferase
VNGSVLPDPFEIVPLSSPPHSTVQLPGSKSITNRALVCAALADGESLIRGALVSDDTSAMLDCLGALGISCEVAEGVGGGPQIAVRGADGAPSVTGAVLDARMSGTTSRFLAPLCVLGPATVVLDGAPSLRTRPMGDLWDALEALGAEVSQLGDEGCLPVELKGGSRGVRGGEIEVSGDVSSQFLSGLLLAAPVMPKGLSVVVRTELVSRPYVEMTLSVMEAFGAKVDRGEGLRSITVAPGGYEGRDFVVEPDASAASYFFALAAASGGHVRIDGLSPGSLQGDVAFVDVLESMGATVHRGPDHIEVVGTGSLAGVSVDMADISDTAQTLAAIAVVANGPTTVSGIGFVRAKETDRIAAVVAELQRLGLEAEERSDGFVVRPGRPEPAVVRTYDDHRMAMSFAVLGLVAPGVSIADPGCVAKTFPGFWDVVDGLRASNP